MSTPHGDPYGPDPSTDPVQEHGPGPGTWAAAARPGRDQQAPYGGYPQADGPPGSGPAGRRLHRRRADGLPARRPVGFGEAVRGAFGHILTFRGRASRSAFWWFVLRDHRLLGHRLHNQPVLGGRYHPRYCRRHPAVAGRPPADGPAAARRAPAPALAGGGRPGADSRLDRAARLLPGAGHTRTNPLQRRPIEPRFRAGRREQFSLVIGRERLRLDQEGRPRVGVSTGGGASVRVATGWPTRVKNSSCPEGAHRQSNRDGVSAALVNVCGGVGLDVDGLAGPGDERLAAKGHLDFAVEHGEHLLEVVPVRWRPAARGHVHVDERVLSGDGVLAGDEDRVGVTDEPDVRGGSGRGPAARQ